MCSVSINRTTSGTQAQVEALAAELDLEEEAPPAIPGAGSMRTWSKFGVMTLTYATGAASDPRGVISVSSQQVVVGTVPASPSEN